MVTALHDTKFFTRYRVSLADVPFPEDYRPARTRLPSAGFRWEMGFFYVFQELQESLIRYLDVKPERPRQQELFVWMLKEDRLFGAISREYGGKEGMVPWWIIKPVLRWQQQGSDGSIIPASGATFFMEAHIEEELRKPVGVCLDLNHSGLHLEWHLRPTEIAMGTPFQRGHVFLSVV